MISKRVWSLISIEPNGHTPPLEQNSLIHRGDAVSVSAYGTSRTFTIGHPSADVEGKADIGDKALKAAGSVPCLLQVIAAPLCPRPNFFQNTPKCGLGSKAHGSICIHERQPIFAPKRTITARSWRRPAHPAPRSSPARTPDRRGEDRARRSPCASPARKAGRGRRARC